MQVGVVSQIWRYPVKSMGGERLQRCQVEDVFGVAGDRGWALWDEEAGELRSAKQLPGLLHCSARYREEPCGAAVPPMDIELADGRIVASDDPQASAHLSAALGGRLRLCARRPADDLDHYRRARHIEDPIAEIRLSAELLPDEPVPDVNLDDIPPELFEFATPPGTYFDAYQLHVITTASLAELARRTPDARIDVRRFRPNIVVDTGAEVHGFLEFDWCGRELRIGAARGQAVLPMMRCAMTTHAQRDLRKEPAIMRTLVRAAQMNFGIGVTVTNPGAVRVGDTVEVV
ncbi:MAG: hypothetical protein H6Q33_3246 [Deltaproteobacteria bacterium]|nr:hypothetical protein [Deltaproteobacteria bacterium]